MSKFQQYYLKDIAVSQTGPFGSQLHQQDYVSKGGTPIVTVEHLGEVGFILNNLPMVSDSDKARLSKYILKEGDIVFSRVGSVDRCTYVTKKEAGWMFSGRCLRVRVNKKANARYVSFYFRQKYFKEMMMNISVGATMSSLNTSLMDNIPLFLPPIESQQKVAAVLSALDAKIELNNRINYELEAMAKTLYNYWFVQFNFPNERGKPYRTSGGRMVYNKGLKRELPEGWEVGNLAFSKISKILDIGINEFTGTKIYLSTSEVENTEIVNHNILEEFGSRTSRANMQPVQNSIWFARMKDTKKVIVISEFCDEIINNYIFSTGFVGIGAPKASLYYLWNFINNPHFEAVKNINSTGSTQKSIINESVANIKLLIPDDEILSKFNDIVCSSYHTIYLNQRENQNLSDLRDWLLPMLMNGQVTVKDTPTVLSKIKVKRKINIGSNINP